VKPLVRDEVLRELRARGFNEHGTSPNDTMVLDEIYVGDVDIADLLEIMVARREKIFRSQDVVGPAAAKAGYDDVVLVIEAIKAVIGRCV
jgi:hypothetical protein